MQLAKLVASTGIRAIVITTLPLIGPKPRSAARRN
jgi:hypothetical protein